MSEGAAMSTPPEQVAAAYDAAAAGYDTHGVPFFTAVGARLVQEAGIAAGTRVLDAGCGAGAVTISAARAAGPEGHVTGIDLSQRMLARTAVAATTLGLDNVTVAKADTHHLPYASGSFDAVLASMLVFLLADPAAAFGEWRRVLADSGIAAFSWIIAEDPRWEPVIAAVDALADGASFYRLWHHPPFTSLSDVATALTAAGYQQVTTTAVTVPRHYTGPRQWWASSWSQAPMLAWNHIPRSLRMTARDEAFRLLDGIRDADGGLTRRTVVGCTTGQKGGDGIGR